MPTYRQLQHSAILISIISILYCSAEGAVSIAFGEESSSRSLIFFGIQSGIEVASACIVLWRFRRYTRTGDEENTGADGAQGGKVGTGPREEVISPADLRVERIGTWGVGILVLLLSLATLATSISGLIQHSTPSSSNASLIISASALICMILIYLPKRYLARALNSSTMAGEAVCSLSCIQITLVLFVGSLVFRLWQGGWWVDSATSIVLGLLFAREAYKMLSWVRNPDFNGGCCDACATKSSLKDPKLELEEQYRNLCECCFEKDECRDSETCKCESSSAEEEPCCVPVNPDDGVKCCSRELVKGQRPSARSPNQDQRQNNENNIIVECIDANDGDQAQANTILEGLEFTGSPKPGQVIQVINQETTKQKQSCCAGCCGD